MASIDLKDAYFSVPIYKNFVDYFKFIWEKQIYAFVALPNGFRDAPRLFTKIMKPIFGNLRQRGHSSVVYIDDSYLQGQTYEQCKLNVMITVRVLIALGFTIHPIKSILDPVREMVFVGFVINSVDMTLRITEEKRMKIKKLCLSLLHDKEATIKQVSRVVGNLVATTEAVPLSPLYYRGIEKEKANSLKRAKGNFKSTMKLSARALTDLVWWVENIEGVYRSLLPLPVDFTIYTDASKIGWGATMDEHHTQGQWLIPEWEEGNINVAEITAAWFALLSFEKSFGNQKLSGEKHVFDQHIRLMIDNTTAVAYINHMGGSKSWQCNRIARKIWKWAEKRGIWISAAHVPGVKNVLADYYSREQNDSKEWSLTEGIFQEITTNFGMPDIDLFGSRTNHKVPQYISWHPDPSSVAVNAFSVDWAKYKLIYCFPPFSLIGRVLKKIREEEATAILITPVWQTQSWYPTVMNMLTRYPLVFKATRNNLFLPHKPSQKHPLCNSLYLMAVQLSGKSWQVTGFQRKLKSLCSHRGEVQPERGMMACLKNGKSFVVKGIKIPFIPL